MSELIENVFLGSGLAVAAAVQPGPLQAFLVSRVAASGWRSALPACLAPLGVFREWREPAASSRVSAPQTVLEAALVNLLNPNPYLGWALVLGPAVVVAWRRHPAYAVGFVVSFYSTMLVTLAAFVVLVGTARTRPRRVRRGDPSRSPSPSPPRRGRPRPSSCRRTA